MMKMFSTQLNGLFNRISSKGEFLIEDGARLLAQATVGEGRTFLKGFAELEGVVLEATSGAEPLKGAYPLKNIDELTSADRVLLFSRFSNDQDAVKLAYALQDRGVEFVAVSGKVEGEETLQNLATIHIDTMLTKGLLPDESGNRIGFPSSMAGLYIYFALKFTLDEMVEEYLELD
ncbi:DUF2529 domain-containing protein [Bacillus spongiae]|uniref:DUF2529 domain-containing protein n=1 Tax=Bacillus spongiae TaxID=2683610 RepID=A0ABU8HI86_9BACI